MASPPDEWTDGDSFRVRLPDGRLQTFRLYFVDISNQLVPIRAGERHSLPYGAWTSRRCATATFEGGSWFITIRPICKESLVKIPTDATDKDSFGCTIWSLT